ncbi:5-bromo-4-chloroindolyl phosphate hydrolysis family protein [Selenomonas sp. AB3002]|uniref:5-bromo-4-chloroindolyl phosphate hydrolysis family protein n=1 Tax=Selenomonas sp. AB3002 TaxID=1392502 RepID=UPI00068F6B8E
MDFFFEVFANLIFLLGVDLVVFLVENYEWIIGGAMAMAAASYGYKRYKLGKDKAPAFDLAALSEEQQALAAELFDKAVADYNAIEALRDTLKDEALGTQLATMQVTAYRLLKYLEENPMKVIPARRFVDYYQDRALTLTKQFCDLEKTGLETAQVTETKQKVRQTLMTFDEAYEAEFEKVLSDQLMDMEAELAVLRQNMKAEGIQDVEGEVISSETLSAMDAARAEANAGNLPEKRERPVNRAGRGKARLRKREDIERERAVAKSMRMPEAVRGEVIKQKVINAGLAAVLGTVGAHKFYQGKTFQGVMYAVFCWTALPTLISWVEAIRYAVMPMDDFYKQYFRD